MKLNLFSLILLLLTLVFCACEREDTTIYILEGYMTDRVSGQGVDGVRIEVDAVKSSSGMGIITDGNRSFAGRATTDKNGYYKLRLSVFDGAEYLQMFINGLNERQGFVEDRRDVPLYELKNSGSNTLNHLLNPTALLKVKFQNTSSASDADQFELKWFDEEGGLTRGVLSRESCGGILENENYQWIGKDVCGIYTIEAIAGRKTMLYWTVTKNNETSSYRDSIEVAPGIINEYHINY